MESIVKEGTMIEPKLCPYDKNPCNKNCMAWFEPKDLVKLKSEHSESYKALIDLIALQECCDLNDAETILELRNNGHCKLIENGPV
jgi:hypothetical protein